MKKRIEYKLSETEKELIDKWYKKKSFKGMYQHFIGEAIRNNLVMMADDGLIKPNKKQKKYLLID